MNLRVSSPKNYNNLGVIRKVLRELDGEGVVELSREAGAVFLAWYSAAEGKNRSISIAIPDEWLVYPHHTANLEATTRNLADSIAKASVS